MIKDERRRGKIRLHRRAEVKERNKIFQAPYIEFVKAVNKEVYESRWSSYVKVSFDLLQGSRNGPSLDGKKKKLTRIKFEKQKNCAATQHPRNPFHLSKT